MFYDPSIVLIMCEAGNVLIKYTGVHIKNHTWQIMSKKAHLRKLTIPEPNLDELLGLEPESDAEIVWNHFVVFRRGECISHVGKCVSFLTRGQIVPM